MLKSDLLLCIEKLVACRRKWLPYRGKLPRGKVTKLLLSDEYFSPTINFRHKQLFPQQMILPKKSILLKDKEKMEKDEETVTLDDPITNQTKEAPVVIID